LRKNYSIVNAGVIGCGRIASSVHLPALKSMEGVKVRALADINERYLEDAKRRFGVEEGYTNYREMLETADLDAVWICTPPQTHQQILLDCIKTEKHILCEKPLSTTFDGALKIKETYEEKLNEVGEKLILMPAHNFLFTPNMDEALKIVREGTIGKVSEIRGYTLSNLTFYRARTDFRIRSGGGVIEDQLPHLIYICQSLGGPITTLRSVEAERNKSSQINSVRLSALTRENVKLQIGAKWTRFLPSFKLEIIGELGTISIDLLKAPYTLHLTREGERRKIDKGSHPLQFLDALRNKHPSYLLENIHFCNCVRELTDAKISIDDGVDVVRTMDMIMSSLKGKPAPSKVEMVAVQRVSNDLEGSLKTLLGMVKFKPITQGDLVIIKPNICYPKNPNRMIITDPELLEAVIKILKHKTSNIVVVESNNNSGKADFRAERSGVLAVIEDSGVEFLNLSESETEERRVAGYTIEIPKIMMDADFILNMPKMKTCNIENVVITISMKNMFGVIANKKSKLHKRLVDILLYINRVIRQDLIVVDGLVAMEGLGPIWGSPVDMNLLVAGTNPVAVDAVCSYIMGIDPLSINLLWRASKEGMGSIDLKEIKTVGVDLAEVRREFEVPKFTLKNIIKALELGLSSLLGR